MEKKKENPMLVRCADLDELESAMRERFNVGTHDACRSFQCSRSWFERNVKPSLHYVFLNRTALHRLRPHDSRGVSMDQCWYDGGELAGFVRKHAVIEQRSKQVHLAAFVDDPAALQEELEAKGLTDSAIEEPENAARRYALHKSQENAIVSHLDEFGQECERLAVSPSSGRASLPWRPYEAPDDVLALFGPAGSWQTVPDMMDYGDVTETIYRKVFSKGMIRCSIEVPTAGGSVTTRHVMYCRDPRPAPLPDPVIDSWPLTVAVPVELWERRPVWLR